VTVGGATWNRGPERDVAPAMAAIDTGIGAGAPPAAGGTRPAGAERPSGPEGDGGGAAGIWALVRLLAVVALIVAVFLVLGAGALLFFIAALVVIVMLHELGHFATAKWSGMKVTEYFVGFGPKLWSVRKGETEYGVKAIPAGGYVKIPGMSSLEEIHPDDEPRTYRQQPVHKRVIVASAGSVMHVLIALALAYVAVVAIGVPTSQVKVGALSSFPKGVVSPAAAAGLKSGDVIVSVNHHPLTNPNQFTDAVGHSVGKPVILGVERDGRSITKVVVPVDGTHIVVDGARYRQPSDHSPGIIGIMQAPVYSPEGPLRGLGTSVIDVGRATSATFAGLGHFFSPHGLSNFYTEVTNSKAGAASAANPQGSDRPMSLIGIGRATIEAQQQGLIDVIEILIAINIGFAILNMLPMLPLDGGHVAIALYERVRTRRGQPFYRADVTKLLPVAYAFMAFLILITFSAVFLDLAHPAKLFH